MTVRSLDKASLAALLCFSMNIRFPLLFVLCIAGSLALAEGVTAPPMAYVQAGIICPPETVGSAPAPGTLAGTTHIIADEPPFVSTARRVPAVLGIGFGIKAQSVAADGIDGVTVIVAHPPMGDVAVQTQSFAPRISGGTPSLTFYQFDYAYELVKGTRHMTAMSGETILYSVAFEVVDPSQAPELAGVCGYLELLS